MTFRRVALTLICLALALSSAIPARTQTTKGKPPAAAATGPADYRSQNFFLHTDLTAEEAKELLERLETMLSLISAYWGRPCSGIIECYVVKNLANWPAGAFPEEGLSHVQAGAGVTVTQTLTSGNSFLAKAVVYAVADRGTPQHEAVHAYCGQTFGTTGPVWYSEGMAEMGQYWRKGDSRVNCPEVIIDYLRNSPVKSLNEIVNGQEFTGDSWQNYAWRWALCHLLANNTNYSAKFRPLGLAILTKRSASFEQTYGDVADRISFEYLFFIAHMAPGYRVDLCSWDWKKKFRALKGSVSVTAKVNAGRGWQASGATLAAGQSYQYTAAGTWQTGPQAAAVTADGAEGTSEGKLLGVMFANFKLSDPFELGAQGVFTAPSEGQLYVRCQDNWGELADNKGAITLKLKAQPAGAGATGK